MLGDSLTSLVLLTWTTALRKFKEMKRVSGIESDLEPPEHKIPTVLWLGGLGGATGMPSGSFGMCYKCLSRTMLLCRIWNVLWWFLLNIVFASNTKVHSCVVSVLATAVLSYLFSMPVYEPILAVVAAALVAILAIRALGETDLNPASGVGKLSQVHAQCPSIFLFLHDKTTFLCWCGQIMSSMYPNGS